MSPLFLPITSATLFSSFPLICSKSIIYPSISSARSSRQRQKKCKITNLDRFRQDLQQEMTKQPWLRISTFLAPILIGNLFTKKYRTLLLKQKRIIQKINNSINL